MYNKKKAKEIYSFILNFILANQYSPSFREISEGVHINSLSTIKRYVEILEKENLIDAHQNQCRCIQVIGYSYQKCNQKKSNTKQSDYPSNSL